jgi:hypothetical protein
MVICSYNELIGKQICVKFYKRTTNELNQDHLFEANVIECFTYSIVAFHVNKEYVTV